MPRPKKTLEAPPATPVSAVVPLRFGEFRVALDKELSNVANIDIESMAISVTANDDGTVSITVLPHVIGAKKSTFSFGVLKQGAITRALAKLDYYFHALVETFVHARWTKTPPTEGGLYAIAARDGSFAGWVDYVPANEEHGTLAKWIRYWPNLPTPYRQGQRPQDVHVGWWFSKPLPIPPSAPDWAVKEV